MNYLLAVLFCSSFASGEIDVDGISKKLSGILHEPSIPPNLAKVVGMLQDSIDILQCLPTRKSGNCYYSQVCRIPKLKVDNTIIPVVIGFCKRPYKISIEPSTKALKRAYVPGWARPLVKTNLRPLVINFNDNHRDGVFRIDTDQSFKAGFLGINAIKVRFLIKASLRYDCTKPRANTVLGGIPYPPLSGDLNALTRCNLNSEAPGGKYNKVYYKIKVRFELKKKRFNWGKLNYKCSKCKDMVNKQGVFGISGPHACVTDVRKGCGRFRKEPRCGNFLC